MTSFSHLTTVCSPVCAICEVKGRANILMCGSSFLSVITVYNDRMGVDHSQLHYGFPAVLRFKILLSPFIRCCGGRRLLLGSTKGEPQEKNVHR